MTGELRSPQILHLSWGRLKVAGLGAFKDAKLYPGGARAWDWREPGGLGAPALGDSIRSVILRRGSIQFTAGK
jgi:hypothetical protein